MGFKSLAVRAWGVGSKMDPRDQPKQVPAVGLWVSVQWSRNGVGVGASQLCYSTDSRLAIFPIRPWNISCGFLWCCFFSPRATEAFVRHAPPVCLQSSNSLLFTGLSCPMLWNWVCPKQFHPLSSPHPTNHYLPRHSCWGTALLLGSLLWPSTSDSLGPISNQLSSSVSPQEGLSQLLATVPLTVKWSRLVLYLTETLPNAFSVYP